MARSTLLPAPPLPPTCMPRFPTNMSPYVHPLPELRGLGSKILQARTDKEDPGFLARGLKPKHGGREAPRTGRFTPRDPGDVPRAQRDREGRPRGFYIYDLHCPGHSLCYQSQQGWYTTASNSTSCVAMNLHLYVHVSATHSAEDGRSWSKTAYSGRAYHLGAGQRS